MTVSQRMDLPEFHKTELRLGENNAAGWSLHAIDSSAKNEVASAQ